MRVLEKLTPPSQPRLPRTFPEEDRNLVNVFHPASFLLAYFLTDARSGT